MDKPASNNGQSDRRSVPPYEALYKVNFVYAVAPSNPIINSPLANSLNIGAPVNSPISINSSSQEMNIHLNEQEEETKTCKSGETTIQQEIDEQMKLVSAL